MQYFRLIWIGLFLFSFANLKAQKRDTLDFYKKIRKSAFKHKSTKLLYQAIFVDPVPQQYEKKPLSDEQKEADPNAQFSGKTIRKIQVIVYDPFGHSVNDTFTRNINKLQKAGNSIHITTRHRIIRNLLLFNVNDTVEMIRITESERLIRQARYINDARIIITGNLESDSADITVKVLDRWSLDAIVGASPEGGYVRLRDRNLSGYGQTYEQEVGYYKATGYEFKGDYNISNFRNTFISSDLLYTINREGTRTGLSVNRPFYSPLARWAGGIDIGRTWGRYFYRDTIDAPERSVAINYYNYDVWVAKSFALAQEKNTEKNSNIVIGARYGNMRFMQRPSFSIDTNMLNINTDIYLVNIGYSMRKYYKDQFIYRFGANEDVPEGLLIQFTNGFIEREFKGLRYYTGIEVSNGRHFKKFGYISGNVIYGTYYREGFMNNSTINGGIFYFSDLNQNRKWYFRKFVNFHIIHGINKEPYEKVTLNPGEMYGFQPADISGTGKMILNLEAVAYAPYNIIGFKFAPVLLAGFGILESNIKKYSSGKIYQAYSTGVLIRNENLLNSSFEFTIGFYPELPDGGRDVFKLNPVGSFTLKVRSFDISKPGTVGYN
jgi:hypothetical protein